MPQNKRMHVSYVAYVLHVLKYVVGKIERKRDREKKGKKRRHEEAN